MSYIEVPDVHVMPINDLREHFEHAGCWCAPRIEESFDPAKGRVIVHNSADGRELVERHGLQ